MSERGIYDPVTDELRQVPCPAGAAVGAVRGTRLANTPGVRCRITHDTLNVDDQTKTLVRWCANPLGGDGGYTECPVWRFDKERIWAGRKSFGDEEEQKAQDERTRRDDLTGSEYGDMSWEDPIEQAVMENIEIVRQTGVVMGQTGFGGGDDEDVRP